MLVYENNANTFFFTFANLMTLLPLAINSKKGQFTKGYLFHKTNTNNKLKLL